MFNWTTVWNFQKVVIQKWSHIFMFVFEFVCVVLGKGEIIKVAILLTYLISNGAKVIANSLPLFTLQTISVNNSGKQTTF